MSWTQACCERCWFERYAPRDPLRLVDPDEEICCFCGGPSSAGIYVRVDPATVPYPQDVT